MAQKPSSDMWASKSRDLQSMFGEERRRVTPGLFNDMDRQWRDKFAKANTWTKRDMSYHLVDLWDNPQFRKDRLNVLRRIWQAPGEALERALRKSMNPNNAFHIRWFTTKTVWSCLALWYGSYYMLYARSDWTRQGGWKILSESKPMVSPMNPHFPKPDPAFEKSKPSEYADQGFSTHHASGLLKPSVPVQW